MAKFSLPIKSTYVPDWGVWECLREFVQNAKDEEDQHGNPMRIEHSGDVLSVENLGADMDRSVLLLGETSKVNNDDLRGQFGEGLNLALLAGCRAGLDITIHTQREKWTPSIEPSKDFGGANCLTVTSRKLRKQRIGVLVSIRGIDADTWHELRNRFPFLSANQDDIVTVPNVGSVLLAPEHKGNIYANGIFVSHLPKFDYGYDLKSVKLDRDRRMVNVWDLQWDIGNLFAEAMSRFPEIIGDPLYRMMRAGSQDVEGVKYQSERGAFNGAMTEQFLADAGEDAVPVTTIEESKRLSDIGKRGVIVPEALCKTIQARMGTVEDMVNAALSDVTTAWTWDDLEENEQRNLATCCRLVDAVSEFNQNLMDNVNVVDFSDPSLRGTCDLETGEINIARHNLRSESGTLRVLIHEYVHATFLTTDGNRSHTSAIESVWAKIWERR